MTVSGPVSWSSRLLSLIALAVVAIVVTAPSGGTGGVIDAPPPARAAVAKVAAPACPLSIVEQERSIKAFAKMTPVFRHPRCLNCHGGVDPMAADEVGNHGGGQMESSNQCASCHDQLAGWDTPGRPMFFVGKSDEALCMQMRTFEPVAEEFVAHIRNDKGGIQFIAAGFKGERGLDPTTQDANDEGVPFAADPPPGDQGQLTRLAEDWVEAMGGKFVGDPECGCVHSKIELKMTSRWTGTGDGGRVTDTVSATVPLRPDSTGLVFSGAAPLEHGEYTITTPPGCQAKLSPSGGELNVTEARFEIGADQRMAVSLAIAPTKTGGTMAFICPKLPIPIPVMPILPWAGEWQYLHRMDLIGREYRFDEFDVASGGSLAGERKLVAQKEVNRSATLQGMTVNSKTTFELWWVGPEASK